MKVNICFFLFCDTLIGAYAWVTGLNHYQWWHKQRKVKTRHQLFKSHSFIIHAYTHTRTHTRTCSSHHHREMWIMSVNVGEPIGCPRSSAAGLFKRPVENTYTPLQPWTLLVPGVLASISMRWFALRVPFWSFSYCEHIFKTQFPKPMFWKKISKVKFKL